MRKIHHVILLFFFCSVSVWEKPRLPSYLQKVCVFFTTRRNICLQGSRETKLPGLMSYSKHQVTPHPRFHLRTSLSHLLSRIKTHAEGSTHPQRSIQKNNQTLQSLSKGGTWHILRADHLHLAQESSAQAVAHTAANSHMAHHHWSIRYQQTSHQRCKRSLHRCSVVDPGHREAFSRLPFSLLSLLALTNEKSLKKDSRCKIKGRRV